MAAKRIAACLSICCVGVLYACADSDDNGKPPTACQAMSAFIVDGDAGAKPEGIRTMAMDLADRTDLSTRMRSSLAAVVAAIDRHEEFVSMESVQAVVEVRETYSAECEPAAEPSP